MTHALLDPVRDRERVQAMIDCGMTFGEVRDAVERFDAPDEQKSALWMLAWSRLNPHCQQRIAERRGMGAVSGL
jgi:hypothetical protein